MNLFNRAYASLFKRVYASLFKGVYVSLFIESTDWSGRKLHSS